MTEMNRIEELFDTIKTKKNQLEYLKRAIEQFNRVDRIVIHYKKTKDIIGNHGCAEADDSFTYDFTRSLNRPISPIETLFAEDETIFELIKDRMFKKYSMAMADLKELEDKKKRLEEFLDMMLRSDAKKGS